MFIHHGKKRNSRHNLQIASLLSFVAGIVNVAGFLAVARLTTNVTGHFAFFVDEVFRLELWQGLVYFGYILAFLLGSFSSNFLVDMLSRRSARFVFIFPTLIESVLLAAIALLGSDWGTDIIACGLLFAMGMQNSLVTRISHAIVRTTHLTGLFTDLGIELSQLFFYRDPENRARLLWPIRLRLTIISFFFIGGIAGGIAYSMWAMNALLLASGTLLMGIAFDLYRVPLRRWMRKRARV